mgnify:FL=1
MKRAALLLRCSTDAQDYERQKLDLLDTIKGMGYTTSDDLVFGQYITGKDDVRKKDRESVAECKQAVREGKVDAIFINEVSRLSRDSIAGRLFIREFNDEYKIPVYFRDLGMWTINPTTRIVDRSFETMLGFYFDMAQNELKSMKTRFASGKRKNAREGKTIGGAVPFGFYKDEDGKLQVDEEQAQVVRLVYNKYLEDGGSIPSVCRYLLSCGYDKKFNKKFGTGSVRNLLRERRYIGEQRYNLVNPDEPDEAKKQEVYIYKVDAIIDTTIYNKVQIKLDKNRTTETKKVNKDKKIHLLAKLITCPICGDSYTSKTASANKSGERYRIWNYCCVSKYNFSECTSDITLNADNIESIIWQLTKREILVLQELSLEERQSKIDEAEQKLASYKDELDVIAKSIDKLNVKKKKLVALFLDIEDDDTAIFNEQREAINKEIDSYNNRIQFLNTEITICEGNIARFKEADFTDEVLDKIEQDLLKKKELIKEYIKVIRPYRLTKARLILEVESKQTNYCILFEPRNSKRRCWYIQSSLAQWQNGLLKTSTAPLGNFFYIPMASLLLDEPDDLDAIASFEDMKEICSINNYVIEY